MDVAKWREMKDTALKNQKIGSLDSETRDLVNCLQIHTTVRTEGSNLLHFPPSTAHMHMFMGKELSGSIVALPIGACWGNLKQCPVSAVALPLACLA